MFASCITFKDYHTYESDIIGIWRNKEKVEGERLLLYSFIEIKEGGNALHTEYTLLKNSSVPTDTLSYPFSYELKNDSIFFDLGDESEPYIEAYKIMHLSKNKMKLLFKEHEMTYRRVKKIN